MRKPRSAKIVAIGLAKPNEDVIAIAEDLLRMAKDGTLRSLVWAGDGGTHVVSGYSPGTDIFSTIGQIERMKHRLLLHAESRTEAGVD